MKGCVWDVDVDVDVVLGGLDGWIGLDIGGGCITNSR